MLNNPIPYNLILDADSYKVDHANQLPVNAVNLQSAGVPRKPNEFTNEIVVKGLEYVSEVYLQTQITQEMIDEAEIEITEQGYEFPRANWEYILEHHDGYLPVILKAIPEGTVVPVGVATYTLEVTDMNCKAWLPSYLETIIQRVAWKMTTVASICRAIRNDMLAFADKTGTDRSHVEYAWHNFGDRGADSHEAAVEAAISHLVFFSGTDCLQANRYIKHLYKTKKPYGSSVIASEHSVMCANADADRRDDYKSAERMIARLEKILDDHDAGINLHILPIVSIVIDTYDARRFCREYLGTRLADRIRRIGERGGKVVARPDSGDAIKMPIEIIHILMDQFGFTVNEKGYKQLPPYIGVIQGDGINQKSIREIFVELENNKLAFSNIVFGSGGGLTHDAGRDEFSFSQKAVWMLIEDGEEVDLFKDPITDIGKRSLRGHITTYLAPDSGRVFSDRTSLQEVNPQLVDLMEPVFVNGKRVMFSNFDDIRERGRKVSVKQEDIRN